MKRLLVDKILILMIALAFIIQTSTSILGAAPVMNTSTILPTTAYANDTLQGWCNATDADGDNVTYFVRWYLNGVENESILWRGYCYQENASELTCNQNTAGSYSYADYCTNPTYTFDSDWSSYATTYGYSVVCHLYMTYYKPYRSEATLSYWQVKDGISTRNLTIKPVYLSYYCWDSYSDRISLQSRINDPVGTGYDYVDWMCDYDGLGGYSRISALYTLYSYEEGIYWYINTTNYTQSLSVNADSLSKTFIKGQNWTLSCLANDGTSNSSWMNSSTITISNLPPNTPTSLSPNSSTYYISDSTPELSAFTSDYDGDAQNITFYHGNGTTLCIAVNVANASTASCNSSTLPDGILYYFAGSFDGTNYSANSTNATFTIDTIAPNLTINNPTSNSVIQNSTVYINITTNDNLSGLDTCYYNILNYTDNTSLQSGTFNCSGEDISFPVTQVNLNISVNDTLGNINNSFIYNITINVDNSPPTITINSPSSSFQGLGFVLNGIVTDNVAVSDCWYRFNSTGDLPQENTTLNCNNSFSIPEAADYGTHTIIVYANDTNSNIGTSSITFTNTQGTGGGGGGSRDELPCTISIIKPRISMNEIGFTGQKGTTSPWQELVMQNLEDYKNIYSFEIDNAICEVNQAVIIIKGGGQGINHIRCDLPETNTYTTLKIYCSENSAEYQINLYTDIWS